LESGCIHKARRHVKSSSANTAPYIARGRLGTDHTLDGSKEELVALIVDSLDNLVPSRYSNPPPDTQIETRHFRHDTATPQLWFRLWNPKSCAILWKQSSMT
jgi:hypothetical protein